MLYHPNSPYFTQYLTNQLKQKTAKKHNAPAKEQKPKDMQRAFVE